MEKKKVVNNTLKTGLKKQIRVAKGNSAELEHKAQTTNVRREFFKSLVSNLSK